MPLPVKILAVIIIATIAVGLLYTVFEAWKTSKNDTKV